MEKMLCGCGLLGCELVYGRGLFCYADLLFNMNIGATIIS